MSDFFEGVRDSTILSLSVLPFAALFGAIAAANGQTVAEATLMSATLYAGASQLVGVQLFGHGVPAWLIILSVLAVNFRHILYSAAIEPHIAALSGRQKALAFFFLTDPQFAETVRRSEAGKPVSFGWYLGYGLCTYIPWVVLSAIGAYFSQLVGDPRSIGLDVLLPVYFMGSVLGFRRRPRFLAIITVSALASILAMETVGSPWHVSLGALAGVAAAAALPPRRNRPEDLVRQATEAAE